MTSTDAPTDAGPAVRSVYETYRRDLAAHRRWTIADRTVTVVLVGSTLLGLSSILFALAGVTVPPVASVSPIGLLVAWLLWRREILTLLGRPGEPRFPHQMLAIAIDADEAALTPRPFGSAPPSMRAFRPDHR